MEDIEKQIIKPINYNILFYCPQFYPRSSGYANASLKFITSVLKYHKNITIDVVTLYPLGDEEELDIERLRVLRLKKSTNIKLIRYFLNPYTVAKKIDKIFNKGGYNLLFVETFDDIIMLSSLSKSTVNKTIVRIHACFETECRFFFSNTFHRIERVFAVFFAKKIKYIASTTSFYITFFKEFYLKNNVDLINNKSYFIIPNSSDANNYISEKSKSYWKTNDKIRIVTVGRMNKGGLVQKGMKDVFTALVMLKDRFPEKLKDFEMIVIGDGEYKEYLKDIVKNHSLDFITFIDYVSSHDELLNILHESDVSILASKFEGLSMFALESLANSNIVLFSKTGGLIDMIDGNGYFFEPGDIKGIADAFENVCKLSEKEISIMKKKSRHIFENRFNEKIVVDKFYDMLKTVVR